MNHRITGQPIVRAIAVLSLLAIGHLATVKDLKSQDPTSENPKSQNLKSRNLKSQIAADQRDGHPLGIHVAEFQAESRSTFTVRDGLQSDNILSLALAADGRIVVGSPDGLASYDGRDWRAVGDWKTRVNLLAPHESSVIGATNERLFTYDGQTVTALADLPEDVRDAAVQRCLAGGKRIWLGTSRGLYAFRDGALVSENILGERRDIRQLAVATDGRLAVAAQDGLYLADADGIWQSILPNDGHRSWAPRDVRGVAFDARGRLWFASPQGVGMWDGDRWTLHTGEDGLPYNDFTTITAGPKGLIWFGTRLGAIRFDGNRWEYRMAPRWLPDNHVAALAVAEDGTAWFATKAGVGRIGRVPMTLREKARVFEDDIDKYHRRTPHGYVDSVYLGTVDDRSEWTQRDSDNDGLWTSMYGAGECFAYAATRDPRAKQRATAAFEAVRFLSQVNRGGSHPLVGFPARSILPTSGPDPNVSDSAEHDRSKRESDPLWKIIAPRWPTSDDRAWYWKCDTSSDELDGHFFLYAVYYDLVAETESEKERAREVTTSIVDHLIANNYALIDHDGQPTRWARYGPDVLNGGVLYEERGLNSLSILSYLKVAEHMTGDAKYGRAYDDLVKTHGYAINTLYPKYCYGPGTGNQSDDEMAFMCYYNLLNYEKDPRLRAIYVESLRWYWTLEVPERNPLFNFIYCAVDEASPHPMATRKASPSCVAEAIDTLRRIPIDRVRWSFQNSHRLDIVRMTRPWDRSSPIGHLRDGKVVPIDERGVEHWNHDPWTLDENHDGRTLTDGAAFLLPYYLGLHHRLIIE